eukprot:COSAG02_NODE_63969_length_262_cov_0.331288_1_plen_43_part_10
MGGVVGVGCVMLTNVKTSLQKKENNFKNTLARLLIWYLVRMLT